jgi:hypothetical protein
MRINAGLRACLLLVGAVVATVGVTPDPSAAWDSNVFSSPTGNIRCRYAPNTQYLTCLTANDGWIAYLPRYGRPVHDNNSTWIGYGRTLRYGDRWRAPGFSCTSRSDGITCRNQAGHGFLINRTDYDSW